MRRIVLAAAMLAAVAAGAAAQDSPTPMQNIEAGKRNDRLQVDRQYEATTRRLQDRSAAEVKVDPWASVRPAEAPPKKRDRKTRPH
jgi:hypothetical protein